VNQTGAPVQCNICMALNTGYASVLFIIYVNLFSMDGRGKIGPVHAMKTYRSSGGMAPLILGRGARWR